MAWAAQLLLINLPRLHFHYLPHCFIPEIKLSLPFHFGFIARSHAALPGVVLNPPRSDSPKITRPSRARPNNSTTFAVRQHLQVCVPIRIG